MNLGAVMDELAAQIGTIAGLTAFGYPPDTVTPPAAIVTYPDEVVFDATYGRGMDTIALPVVVVVGRASDRASRGRLSRYLDGSGSHSIKATLEADGLEWASFDTVRVMSADEIDIYQIGGVDLLSATLRLDIAGTGAP